MAMYDNPPIATRNAVAHEVDPELQVGDRVRLKRNPGTMPGHDALDGALGTVVRMPPAASCWTWIDEYVASGLVQKQFYSYPGELERIERVGRMGAVDLFADDQE